MAEKNKKEAGDEAKLEKEAKRKSRRRRKWQRNEKTVFFLHFYFFFHGLQEKIVNPLLVSTMTTNFTIVLFSLERNMSSRSPTKDIQSFNGFSFSRNYKPTAKQRKDNNNKNLPLFKPEQRVCVCMRVCVCVVLSGFFSTHMQII